MSQVVPFSTHKADLLRLERGLEDPSFINNTTVSLRPPFVLPQGSDYLLKNDVPDAQLFAQLNSTTSSKGFHSGWIKDVLGCSVMHKATISCPKQSLTATPTPIIFFFLSLAASQLSFSHPLLHSICGVSSAL
jgi:hypothetical protein